MELSAQPARVRIVLPALDEARCLEPSLKRLVHFCSQHLTGYAWSVLIADNGSTDGTAALADGLAGADERVEVIHLERPGRGRALQRAAGLPGADYLVYSDVDLSADLDALPRLLAALDSGADLAVGTRLHPEAHVERRLFREALSRGYNLMLKTVLGVTAFGDAQCGLKAWRVERLAPVLSRVRDANWFFDTELLVLAEYGGYRIDEVPVRWIEDPDSRVRIPATVVEKLRGVLRLRLTAQRNGRGSQ